MSKSKTSWRKTNKKTTQPNCKKSKNSSYQQAIAKNSSSSIKPSMEFKSCFSFCLISSKKTNGIKVQTMRRKMTESLKLKKKRWLSYHRCKSNKSSCTLSEKTWTYFPSSSPFPQSQYPNLKTSCTFFTTCSCTLINTSRLLLPSKASRIKLKSTSWFKLVFRTCLLQWSLHDLKIKTLQFLSNSMKPLYNAWRLV